MPFFATLFMAVAFFYFQYTYTRFKIVDFNEFVFYGSESIFSPTEEEYIVLLYNSKSSSFIELAKKVQDSKATILAIDFYQNTKQKGVDNVIPLSAGMNTLLKFSRVLKVDSLPAVFRIKRKSIAKYTQDSKIINITYKD